MQNLPVLETLYEPSIATGFVYMYVCIVHVPANSVGEPLTLLLYLILSNTICLARGCLGRGCCCNVMIPYVVVST